MFVRYLGGGIGHLEQFPPANNDTGVVYEYEDDDEGDDAGIGGAENGGSDQGGDIHDGEEGSEDAEDVEAAEGDEYSDHGESSDEDMGNMY